MNLKKQTLAPAGVPILHFRQPRVNEPQIILQKKHLLSHQRIHLSFYIIHPEKLPKLTENQQVTEAKMLPKFAVSKVTAEMVEMRIICNSEHFIVLNPVRRTKPKPPYRPDEPHEDPAAPSKRFQAKIKAAREKGRILRPDLQ